MALEEKSGDQVIRIHPLRDLEHLYQVSGQSILYWLRGFTLKWWTNQMFCGVDLQPVKNCIMYYFSYFTEKVSFNILSNILVILVNTILKYLYMVQLPHNECISLLTWKIPSWWFHLSQSSAQTSYSNLCNMNQFYIHKVCIPHTAGSLPAGRLESLLHFSLLTDLLLMYFFTSDFSWLLSKHRLDTTPAVPAPPLKNTHWAFLTVSWWITTVVTSVWEYTYVQFILGVDKKQKT